MPLPDQLHDDLLELMARRFRAMGDPLRIRVLCRLEAGEASVNELADGLGASQQNISKHLAVLAEAGFVARRKHGTRVYYRICDQAALGLCDQVHTSVQDQLRALQALVAD